ncbi:hypothetical protein KY362_05745 [Candidatus Woesearchaeota archaeon]|nr:hypothetical protein [Candidatus Woesearchaeota archaeon]
MNTVAKRYLDMLLEKGEEAPEFYCRLMHELDRGIIEEDFKIGLYWKEDRMWFALILAQAIGKEVAKAKTEYKQSLDQAMSKLYERSIQPGDFCLYRETDKLKAGMAVNGLIHNTPDIGTLPDNIVCRLRPDFTRGWEPGDIVAAVDDDTYAIGYAWLMLPDHSLWVCEERTRFSATAIRRFKGNYGARRLVPDTKTESYTIGPYR